MKGRDVQWSAQPGLALPKECPGWAKCGRRALGKVGQEMGRKGFGVPGWLLVSPSTGPRGGPSRNVPGGAPCASPGAASGPQTGKLPAAPVLKRVLTLAVPGPWRLLVRRPGGHQGRK